MYSEHLSEVYAIEKMPDPYFWPIFYISIKFHLKATLEHISPALLYSQPNTTHFSLPNYPLYLIPECIHIAHNPSQFRQPSWWRGESEKSLFIIEVDLLSFEKALPIASCQPIYFNLLCSFPSTLDDWAWRFPSPLPPFFRCPPW